MRHRLLVACTLGLAACTSAIGQYNAMPDVEPAVQRTVADAAVAAALHYALVSPGDLPHRRWLPDSSRIPVTTEVLRGYGVPPDTLTARVLPQTRRVRFVLLTPRQIRTIAREEGRFAFVAVERPDVRGDTAEVFVGVREMAALDPSMRSQDGFSYSGAGYTLRLVWRGGEWVALKPTSFTMS